jgi:DNA-binding transcriptional LysR family regulator
VIDLQDVAAFRRVADTGSLSAAARLLDLPKSSMSRSIARLESAVGTVLVERSSRGLRLTDAGELFLSHAERILAEVEESQLALDSLIGSPMGTLRINAAVTFAAGLIAPMLPAFMRRYPEVRVILETENRVIDLTREDADVAIRIGKLEDSDLLARKLGMVELWPCASPAYLAAHGEPRTVADLASHKLFGWFDGPSEWEFTTPEGQTEILAVPVGSVVPEPIVFHSMLLDGVGIGRAPDFLAAPAVRDGSLVRLLPDHGCEAVEAHALYPSKRSLSPKVRVFIDALLAHLRTNRAC